ncbi:MAG: prenyltransferase [Chloroflexota bacterium]
MSNKIQAIVKLSRWRQHVPYTLPLVIIGALIATNQSDTTLDWRLLPVTIANILAMVFAFMINDVIDAPDDARNPVKTESNVISQGLLSVREAGFVCVTVFVLSVILFAQGGLWSLIVGLTTLILSFLYSAPVVRLKARLIVDVLSHVLMLSALLLISGYVVYDTTISTGWWVILGVSFASAYGQFYNQVDDFENDKVAGLNNTAMLLGRANTVRAMTICAVLTMICFIIAIIYRVFPFWLGWVLGASIIIVSLFQWDIDMRGNETDTSGMVQRPVLITANMVAFMWLLYDLGLLGIG